MFSCRTLAFAVGIVMVAGTSAHAAAARTAVSGSGNDANPCTLAQPCRTLQGAFNNTAPGGEIEVLDPAGYGGLNITHAISIQGHGWAAMNASSGAVINITGSSAKVVLQGLIIDGFGLADQGILVTVPGELSVLDCTVRNTLQAGIAITSHSESHVTVANSVVVDNQGDGIATAGAGAGINALSLDHVQLVHNGLANSTTGAGLRATGGDAAFGFTAINASVISANPIGIVSSQTSADGVTVLAANSQIVHNQTAANIGAGTTLVLEKTTIWSLRNPIVNSGAIISYGDNAIRDTISGNSLTAASPALR